MQRIGIVDLGSNTARLVVFEYEPGDWFRLVGQIREPVRLGEGLWKGDGDLSEAAMQRAEAALKLYSEYASTVRLPEIEVIATSAVRDAANAPHFLRRLGQYRLPVRVLSGEEEARYSVLAVANSFAVEDAWVIDLGGGSAQISRMRARRFEKGVSYPLGAVHLTESFLESDPPRNAEMARLESHVERYLEPVLDEIRKDGLPLIAMGGTIRNLARAAQRRDGYPLDQRHGYFFRREELEATTGRLLGLSRRKRAHVPGIEPDRADVILAGALVFQKILRDSRMEGMWISGQGLREGAFYSRFLPEPHLVEDVRRFAVHNLFRHYPQPEDHIQRVRAFSQRLFEALRPLHGMGRPEAEILDAAAWLHDVGMTIGYFDHHKHGAYLIETGLWGGFTHREQALIINLVRFHRKGNPKWGALRRLAQAGDKKLLLRLTVCLRLAEYLERSQAGRVEEVQVELTKNAAILTLQANEYPYVELWETQKQAGLFESAFGKKLELRAVTAEVATPSKSP